MRRTSRRPSVGTGQALLLVLALSPLGCNSRGSASKGPLVTPNTSPPPASPGAKPFADWPRPAGALVISGQQDGYLEPCGCTEGQKGGLGRRFDLLDRLRKQGWPLAMIDLGSLAHDPATDRGGPEEVKLKFGAALHALDLMKYDALALGANDLKLGVGDTLMRIVNTLKDRPRVVSANVTLADGIDQTGVFRKSVRTEAGPVKIGITAVLDPDAFAALNDPDKAALLTFQEPAEVLPAVLADLEKDTQVQVLMVQGAPEKATEKATALALAFPGFDIVVATSAHPDPDKEPVPLNDGKTLLISVGRKGQYVGVVGLYQDVKTPFRYQRVMLNSRYDQAEAMRTLLDVDLQEEYKAARVVEDFPRRPFVGGAPGAKFVGAEACQSCHPNTFARWRGTGHARAYEGLLKPGRNREADAECVSCHTTGFQYDSGFRSATETAHLKGNQCENCHGPASKHIQQPDDAEARKAIALTADRADRNRLCLQCHDEDNSPHFKFESYYPKVAHKGLDTYNDPKVHRSGSPQGTPAASD